MANIADNDFFRIYVGGTATNQGFVEFATADDGTEPIYVRQYTGVFATITRTATLLDGSGDTQFPGTITSTRHICNVATGTAPFTVTSTTRVSNLNVANAGYADSAGSAGSLTNALTIGTGLGGTSYNGASAVTITNTGVTSIVGGTNISVSGATGAVTVNVSGTVANATYAVSAGSAGSASSATTAGSVTNAVTFNSSGSGDASGTTYNGGAARTISYNTVGAPSTGGTNASGTWGINITGSAGSATTAGTVTTAAQPNITSTGTLTRVIVGDGSQSSPSMAFASDGAIDTGFYWGGDGYINWTNNGVFRGQFRPDGTAQIGTVLTTSITTGASSTAGTFTGNWSLGSGSRLNATYADLAEYYKSDVDLVAGDVVVLGGEFDVTLTEESHDHRVAGIVSTDPAYLMNKKEDSTGYVAVALTGRVPCKVIGPVRKGDLLVSSSQKGVAQKLDNTKWIPGCVIGKAMENINEGLHIIEVAVGRF